MTIQEMEKEFIASFLDSLANFFDADQPIYPNTLIADPVDGEAIEARLLLQRIRLHESVSRLGVR